MKTSENIAEGILLLNKNNYLVVKCSLLTSM